MLLLQLQLELKTILPILPTKDSLVLFPNLDLIHHPISNAIMRFFVCEKNVFVVHVGIWSRSDSAQPSFSMAEMDIESSSSSWPEETKSATDGGGWKHLSEKVTGDRGDRWEWWLHAISSPPPSGGEGGPNSGSLVAVGLTPRGHVPHSGESSAGAQHSTFDLSSNR